MAKMKHLKGIVPVLITPLLEDGSVDVKGLTRLVEFLLSKKIGGLFVLGTGGEDHNLTFEKRLEVAKVVAKVNAGRVPTIFGAGFYAVEDIMGFIKETSGLGIDSYHVMPYHPILSLNRLEWFYNYIADNSPKPIWLYSSIKWSSVLPPEFVVKLKDHSNIVGIKTSTRNNEEISRFVKLKDDNFQVMTAVAKQTYACFTQGVLSHTTSLGSCMPEILIKIYELVQEGKYEEALKTQQLLNNFYNDILPDAGKDNGFNIAEEKYVLSLRGICNEYTTSYYRCLTSSEKDNIKALLKKYPIIPTQQI